MAAFLEKIGGSENVPTVILSPGKTDYLPNDGMRTIRNTLVICQR
jgi:hypothetical protein